MITPTWVTQPDYRRLLRARYDEQKPTSDCDILGEVDQLAHESRCSGRRPKRAGDECGRHPKKEKSGSCKPRQYSEDESQAMGELYRTPADCGKRNETLGKPRSI